MEIDNLSKELLKQKDANRILKKHSIITSKLLQHTDYLGWL